MLIDVLGPHPGEWLTTDGPESDIVISTRIRLARNVEGHHMPWRMANSERDKLDAFLHERIRSAAVVESDEYWNVDELEDIERQFLVERHLISRELAQATGRRGVVFSRGEAVSIMSNEEDHLRIQVLRSGLQIDETWRHANMLDDALEKQIPYSFSPRFGYLTACPSNVGTGLRVSVMTHLPTLVHTKQIDKVYRAASKVGLVLRGLFGEGTKASGDFYQISNQVTLGRSEEDLVRDVHRMVIKIVEWERGIRSLLLEQDRTDLEDRIWRAYGILRSARRITSEETMEHLSALRLGINLKIIRDQKIRAVNELFLLTQPAHLQLLLRSTMDPRERDSVRARFIRDRLNSENN